ncbi:MAG: GNAT family N-acetyltransferase [Oscillospiraceae bacterium]|nr:GNAT family N-acetyltransferase [Oscillospiraceae bacterium]
MNIRLYSEADEHNLREMILEEGDGWEGYWSQTGAPKYRRALSNSIVLVAYQEEELCGYIRCREDDGLGVYIYDLLVRKSKRGERIGRTLMDRVCADFPGQEVYVMSDVDGYYQKQGYSRIGSVFQLAGGVQDD